MTDHGEPWGRSNCLDNLIGSRDGFTIAECRLEKDTERIIVCINALAGIDNVEAFVKEAKELMIVKGLTHRHFVKKNEEAHNADEG